MHVYIAKSEKANVINHCRRLCESQQDMRNSHILYFLIVKYKRRLNVRLVLVSCAASHLSFTDFAVVLYVLLSF